MEVIERHDYRGGRVDIVADPDGYSMNPRENESNLSRFVFRPQRDIIDVNEIGFRFDDYDYEETDETEEEWAVRKLREDYGALYVIAVHYSEHGPQCRYDVWSKTPDAIGHGEIGYAIVTRESADEIGTSEDMWPEVVEGEVLRYGEWANGDVFGYVTYAPNGDEIESVWGYIGYDEIAYMVTEGKSAIDWFLRQREETCESILADAMQALVSHVG